MPRNRGRVTTVIGALTLQGIDAIESRGARVVFLPPYSPIEPAWSKLKALPRKWRTRTCLRLGIKLALSALASRDAACWFTHRGYPVAQLG
ncbi:hypothetical protein [Corallococcus llansteffanensis]|uniref:Tc1-like transposase DDE domain-containing protein n=1 Tax=Corallococcus llansteffanensis TaxID=2316731 RepID=A0A3A8P544_9BACT|nr:hypothetical protein D7V93_29030 [Corallococcus llansteffanensis]